MAGFLAVKNDGLPTSSGKITLKTGYRLVMRAKFRLFAGHHRNNNILSFDSK